MTSQRAPDAWLNSKNSTVAPDKELVHGTLRLTRAQWEKVRMAGVPALRLLIDRWRPKKP